MERLIRNLWRALLFFFSFHLEEFVGVVGLKLSEQPLNTALAFFPFASGSLLDVTGNGNHPLIWWNVRPAADRFGKPDHALYFDGSAYLSGKAASFPRKDRTIALWWKSSTVENDGTDFNNLENASDLNPVNNSNDEPRDGGVLFAYGGGETCGTSFFMSLNHWTPCYESQGHCRSNQILTCNQTTSAFSPPPPLWHHWAISVNSNITRVYIDGILVNTTDNFLTETNVEGSHFSIGVNIAPNGVTIPYTDVKYNYFTGFIDDLVIYNYSLLPYEIEKLAADRLPLTPSAKLSYGWLVSLTFPVLLVSFFVCYLLPPTNRKLRASLLGRTPPLASKIIQRYGSLGQ